MTRITLIGLCFVFCTCVSCRREKQKKVDSTGLNDSIYYARGFQIESHPDFKLVSIKNPWHSDVFLQTYILVPKTKELPLFLPEGIVIRTPLERTVVF